MKGHKDSNTLYAALPLEAQLNVNADTEAGYYQCQNAVHWPIIPRLPSDCVQLHITGHVISSKAQKRIWEAFTLPPYLHYIQGRFQWTDTCAATIDKL